MEKIVNEIIVFNTNFPNRRIVKLEEICHGVAKSENGKSENSITNTCRTALFIESISCKI